MYIEMRLYWLKSRHPDWHPIISPYTENGRFWFANFCNLPLRVWRIISMFSQLTCKVQWRFQLYTNRSDADGLTLWTRYIDFYINKQRTSIHIVFGPQKRCRSDYVFLLRPYYRWRFLFFFISQKNYGPTHYCFYRPTRTVICRYCIVNESCPEYGYNIVYT